MVKFLYILVSNEKDIYYEQTLVSVISLRHYNPDAFVSLLVDDKTDKSLVGFRAGIKDLVNEYKVIMFDEKIGGLARSRLLKTNMRNLLEGDFLYLDGDTAFVDKLEVEVDDSCDVGGIPDLHSQQEQAHSWIFAFAGGSVFQWRGYLCPRYGQGQGILQQMARVVPILQHEGRLHGSDFP